MPDWRLLQQDAHAGVLRLVGTSTRCCPRRPRCTGVDFEPAGFQWVTCEDRAHSVLAFLRCDERQRAALVVCPAWDTRSHCG